MKLIDVIRKGVWAFADIGKYNMFNNQTNTMYAFMTELGLCLVGLYQIGDDQNGSIDYFDLRCRFFLGEINNEFNLYQPLKINHESNDAKYGLYLFNNKAILTATDWYRFLASWSENEIVNAIKARFGSYLITPFLVIPGLNQQSNEFYLSGLKSIGIDNLLSINNIVNYDLIDREI